MQPKTFALVDCNNFYVSCERLFDPSLKHKPVAVLSNNDGIMVSRSNEVKVLGIPMGAAAFKWKDAIKKHNIVLFSSNYTIYGDISSRIMHALQQFTSDVECYSIDEAFLDLTNTSIKNFTSFGKDIRSTLDKWTGIPVTVGIAPTKTLTKIAVEIAKKHPQFNGVLDLTSVKDPNKYLSMVRVGDIWGVGRKYSAFLEQSNIFTAKDLKYAGRNLVKKRMTVMGERTILELNEVSCIPINKQPSAKKAIACTRTFGSYQRTYHDLAKAVSYYTANAAEKLRSQNSKTRFIQVFILTNLHNKNHHQYHNSVVIKLPIPTSYTPELIHFALQGLKRIYCEGFLFKKAGVIFMGIQPNNITQLDMLGLYNHKRTLKQNRLMQAVDSINKSWSKNTIKFASQGTDKKWWMSQSSKSQRFTTAWSELLTVKV